MKATTLAVQVEYPFPPKLLQLLRAFLTPFTFRSVSNILPSKLKIIVIRNVKVWKLHFLYLVAKTRCLHEICMYFVT